MYVSVEKETFETEKKGYKQGAEHASRPILDTYNQPAVRWQILSFTAAQEQTVPSVLEAPGTLA